MKRSEVVRLMRGAKRSYQDCITDLECEAMARALGIEVEADELPARLTLASHWMHGDLRHELTPEGRCVSVAELRCEPALAQALVDAYNRVHLEPTPTCTCIFCQERRA